MANLDIVAYDDIVKEQVITVEITKDMIASDVNTVRIVVNLPFERKTMSFTRGRIVTGEGQRPRGKRATRPVQPDANGINYV